MQDWSGLPREALIEALGRTSGNLTALLENTTDFILVCDAAGAPVLFNEAYREIMAAAGIEMQLGLRPHTLLGRGAVGFIQKPYRLKTLADELRAALELVG